MTELSLTKLPYVEGVLTAEQVAESAASIVSMQEPSGAVPWTVGEHVDVWNHVEAAMALLVGGQVEAAERAYAWVRRDNDVFGGQSALTRMLAGDVTDLAVVRAYLDAERGGW